MIKFYLSLSRYLTVFLVCISSFGYAQEITVSGKVTSADDGSPVPGANVIEKGTSNGIVTDANGEFKINVGANAVLSISFVGFKTQDVEVGSRSFIAVVMETDVTSLSEVVVVGYGQQEKKDVTGVVAAVDEKNFNKGVIVSPDQLLNGKVAGVQITPADGQPGSGGNVRIRGGTSLSASNEPLYVIDGFPVVNDGTAAGRNPLNFINANDIETFTVLKDASAAAIYGSRAANGVIIITTKKGKNGAPSITYDGYFSSATVAKKYDVFNADQFRSLVTYWAPQNLQYLGDNSNNDTANKAYNTDWQNQIFRQAPAFNHNLTVSGGSDKTNYRFSVGYLEQQGIINTSSTQKTSLGMNLTQLLFNDDLKVDANFKVAQMQDRFSPSVIGDALQFDPTHPVYDAQSQYAGYYEYFKYDNQGNRNTVMLAPTNPVSNLNQTKDVGRTLRALGNIQLDYKIKYVPGLRAVVNLGYDVTLGGRQAFQPSTLKYESTPDTGKVTIQNPYKYSKLFEGYLNYKKQFTDDHKIDLTAGYSWQDFYSENYGYNATRLSTNVYGFNNPAVAKQTIPWNPNIQYNRLISFYGRVNYSYRDKYLITANIRRDGTTKVSPLNQWGTFPSVAVGWRLINEPFMQSLQNVFSDLKLRAGYGVVGNQDIGNYLYLPSYTPSDALATYPLGSTYYTTIRPSGYDAYMKWEQTATTNFGLDFGFFNGRMTGALEVYQKNTSNLLFNKAVAPGANNTNQITTNIGKMQNQGVELSLNAVALDKGGLKWNIAFNAAYNQNKIEVLDGNSDPTYAGYLTGGISGGVGNNAEILRVGQPVNSFFVYQHKTGSDGKPVGDNFGNAPLTDMYVDQNNDGSINEKDLRPYKKPLPDWIMGLTSNLTYKDWDLSLTLRANLGNYVYNNIASGASYKNLGDNFWPRNMTTQVVKTDYFNPQYFSDYFVQNASFLRMDNITLGYNFNKLTANTKVKLRLYGTVQNAFVITNYRGLDPEIQVNTGVGGTAGIDNNLYPRARTFTVGVRVGF